MQGHENQFGTCRTAELARTAASTLICLAPTGEKKFGLSRWQLLLLTVDRGGMRRMSRIGDINDATIDAALAPVVAADAVLCSDKAGLFAAFALKPQLQHSALVSTPGGGLATPAHHIQNANTLHFRYRDFIRPFRGPAKSYLGRYLAWFMAREALVDPRQVFAAALTV